MKNKIKDSIIVFSAIAIFILYFFTYRTADVIDIEPENIIRMRVGGTLINLNGVQIEAHTDSSAYFFSSRENFDLKLIKKVNVFGSERYMVIDEVRANMFEGDI